MNIASMYICCARRHQHEHTKGPSQSSQCTQQEKLIDFPSTPALPLPPCPPLLRHAAESACVHREPRAPPPAGFEGFVDESPGVKTLCAQFRDPSPGLRDPKHRRAPVPPQALLSFPPPHPATGLFRRDAAAGPRGWAQVGDLLILKI